MISTGTAIAPCVSMLRTHRDAPPWRRAVVMNGVRVARDLGYRAELAAQAARDTRLVYLPMATREPADSGWEGLRIRVTDAMAPDRFRALAGFDLDPGATHVYVSGNPNMIGEVEPLLVARGFHKHTPRHPGNLHLEKYWAD
jgi:ferredoxin/flavodoxin---NADP+ reductase